ncbi:MAG TPA: glutamine--fructose-6-phosphate transaminase (isomerizing) [Acidimicrobiales bacterium]|nr:glutamine--fructose-6-phosphate transaminase (isomerizing) [Acidimicrobiales bacterium]
MCGIIGVTGDDGALETILDGLRRLEYRGYDSAGVALAAAGALWRERAADGTHSVEDLAAAVAAAPPATAGIGHTRWATHGGPTVQNAHPHADCTGRVALVHNGIIENHAELAAPLVARGHAFASETDTEVLAHLLEEELARGASLAEAMRATLAKLRGAFSVVVLTSDDPDLIVAARRSVPLLAGLGEGTAFVASDVSALLGRADRYFALEDDQVAEVRPGSLVVTSLAGEEVDPTVVTVDPSWDVVAAQMGGFDDFMSKEIHEQPRAIADTLLDRRAGSGSLVLDELHLSPDELRAVDKVVVVACGSSFHAAMVAKHAIERWARLPAEVEIASELRYREPVLHERTLVVGASQSGETLDTLEALREARRAGARTIVVSNVVHSTMAREADGTIYTRAGPEVSVASTKCHLAQIVALEVLALALAQWRGTMGPSAVARVLDELHRLPAAVEDALGRAKEVGDVADALGGARDFFFIGRNLGYPVALEGALKLKEISYLRAEGYPAGELKHGPLALIEPGTVVVAVLDPLRDKMRSNVAEAAARGATVVAVAADDDLDVAGDHVLRVPSLTDPVLAPVVQVVPLQLLAYGLARRLGNDVDRPRNLAKTVTVE